MYEVKIYNNGIEKLIHTPTANKEAPHILNLPFKESLSMPEQLSFSIPYGNPGYDLIEGLLTKVKVYDTRANTVIFSGRVIPFKDGMTSDGKFNKVVTCEGALAYLNDSHTRRWNFTNQTPQQILQYLLDRHNEKMDMDSSRKIYLGEVEVNQAITIDTNHETTLNAVITKVRNILGGDIRVQERNGVLYLDYFIAQGANNGVEIRLMHNLKEIIRENDPMDVITRGIVLGYGEGINQLGIESVNEGTEYIEDAEAVAKYGVIEGLITNKDIQNADTLKIYGQTVLNEKKQPRFSYEQTALDLSVLTGHENEKYELGDTLQTIVEVLNIDVYSRVIERDRDLLIDPWNPRLTISTRPIKLTDHIIDIKQRNMTLENAPQGSTCIFPLSKAENADATHPIEFDLDIPNEAVNINKVFINLHGRKFRANSKDTAAGGSSTATSSSGGGSTVTSSSGGDSTVSSENTTNWGSGWSYNIGTEEYELTAPVRTDEFGSNAFVPRSGIVHNHSVGIPSHTHNVSVQSHTHSVTIPTHVHEQDYGIYEGTYPKNVKIKVNSVDIEVNYGDGTNAFDEYNIDITSRVSKGNNKIQITTEQNGRIDAIIYSQIFIQSK